MAAELGWYRVEKTVPRPYAFIVGSGDFLFPLPKLGRCAGINRLEANIYETSK